MSPTLRQISTALAKHLEANYQLDLSTWRQFSIVDDIENFLNQYHVAAVGTEITPVDLSQQGTLDAG